MREIVDGLLDHELADLKDRLANVVSYCNSCQKTLESAEDDLTLLMNEALRAQSHITKLRDSLREGKRQRQEVLTETKPPTAIAEDEDLSETAQEVINHMRQGWWLRVPHERPLEHGMHDVARIVVTSEPPEIRGAASLYVKTSVVNELLNSGRLYKLTEFRNGDRIGWREKGLDGGEADWYCLEV